MLIFITIMLVGAALSLGSLIIDTDDMSDALSADHGHGGSDSVFSIRTLLLFATVFGAAGTITLGYDGTVTTAILIGSVCGVLAAVGGIRVTKFFQRQEGDSTRRADDLLNRVGHVVFAIPADGFGQVMLTDRTGRMVFLRAASEQSVPEGTPITVVGLLGDAVIVTRDPTKSA